jgi:nitroreductase
LEPRLTGLEDHAATAAAVQNFMLSLAAEGFGSKWMTGALGIAPDAILDAVGADKTAERFMGVIWHGQPATPLAAAQAPARSKGVDGVLKRLA